MKQLAMSRCRRPPKTPGLHRPELPDPQRREVALQDMPARRRIESLENGGIRHRFEAGQPPPPQQPHPATVRRAPRNGRPRRPGILHPQLKRTITDVIPTRDHDGQTLSGDLPRGTVPPHGIARGLERGERLRHRPRVRIAAIRGDEIVRHGPTPRPGDQEGDRHQDRPLHKATPAKRSTPHTVMHIETPDVQV